MIKNYLLVAFRNLWRHRAFSLINILGLTVGLTAFFLIFLYVRFELSYDSFNTKADRIYRVVADIKTPTETLNSGGPAWAVGAFIKKEFPDEVEAAVRTDENSFLFRRGDVKYQEEHSLLADSDFFKVFDFKLIHGDPATCLREPMSVVLTESAAKKYFGSENPMGKTLIMTSDNFNTQVTGVMKDMPENSQIKADVIVSMTTRTSRARRLDSAWGNYGNRTFILLKPGINYKSFQNRLPAFLDKYDGGEMKSSQMFPTLFLEPLRWVYLYSTRDDSKTGHITNVYTFTIVALFILLIACFNFVNLTTARAAERAREVGIRKVVGAVKTQLSRQFIGESVVLCLIAFILALALTSALLPSFNNLSGKVISHTIFTHPQYILVLLAVALGVGILAGIYPALVLSSFKPVETLKGRFSTGTHGVFLRRGLVVVQFTISIGLIIGTIIVYSQMMYMRNADLGFNKTQKLVIDTEGDPARMAFRNALTTLPNVRSVSMAGSVPGGDNPGAYSQIQNVKGEMQIANLDLYFVDFDYIPQYQMKIIAGRAFSRDFGSDTTQAMIVNEAAVKDFGYRSPKDIIGRKFDQWGRSGMIIGVVKDFHFHSLQEVIKPLSIRIEPDGCYLVTAEVPSGPQLPETIAAIEKEWKKDMPHRPFSYYFLDEYFDRQYRAEDRFGKLFLDFAILAIFISCLGLLGLASYSTLQRTKEIGIRKVLGASVRGIVGLLSKEFVLLVGVAFVVATPVAWYLMNRWLQDFAYKVSIAWWVFAAAGLTALVIALLTVSFQAIRAALANPVQSLRTE
ncbi:ABC transporter permease [Dinghuibacter silviterrae]|uniref:Putative ABC transport system permease protein n=1 Tax=Dinghuibacter silviterrae TaxID=1539049 RepID=A0A4R8DIS4_9BACT|nr:ABC transporter permease [Dinghuibacter silviterrae]TDW97408.1 putative ABC transport system permease protein [Dinghuibacter silviterrae]